MFILDCFERDMIKDVLLSKRQLGTNHLSVGYESSQLWVRIVWVGNVHGYETSGFPTTYGGVEGPIYQRGKGIQEILLYLYAEAIWPVTGQGFQNTK